MQTLVLIGASTGGPGHLKKILSDLKPSTKASYIIVQHMNENVVGSFVSELSKSCNIPVLLAKDKQIISPSSVYVCSYTLEFFLQKGQIYLQKSKKEAIYTPSINILFNSAVHLLPKYAVVPIVLTGIGDDGATAMHSLYKKGALCISESQKSAIVYGMPKQVYKINSEVKVMHLDEIIKFLQNV